MSIFEVLKEDVETIIDELYVKLSRRQDEQTSIQLLQCFRNATRLLKKIQSEINDNIDENAEFNETLKYTRQNLDQTKGLAELFLKKQATINGQNNALLQFIKFIHQYCGNVKMCTLAIKRQKILKKQILELKEQLTKFKKLNENETMFYKMQLEGEKDDSKYTLNQIKKSAETKLAEAKKQYQVVSKELKCKQKIFTEVKNEYDSLHKQQCEKKLSNLADCNFHVEARSQLKESVKMLPQQAQRRQKQIKIKPMKYELISTKQTTNVEKMLIGSLLFATILLLLSSFTS